MLPDRADRPRLLERQVVRPRPLPLPERRRAARWLVAVVAGTVAALVAAKIFIHWIN